MARPKFTLSPADIESLKNQGMTQSEIAREFDYSRQAVSNLARTYNLPLTPRQEILEQHFPWAVPAEQTQTAPYKNMRNHGEWYATNGRGMSADALKRLQSFWNKLRNDNLVLEFDPALPPVPRLSNKGGFAYRKRLKRDAGLMIRVNEYTRLTEQGEKIWRLPPELLS